MTAEREKAAWEYLQPEIDRIVPIACDQGIDVLLPPERDLYLVWCYSGEVDNGGHAQFFFNSAGEHAVETARTLERIGAPEFSWLLLRAIQLFPEGVVPIDISERNDALQALPPSAEAKMNRLDDEYSQLDRGDRLMNKLLQFWRSGHA